MKKRKFLIVLDRFAKTWTCRTILVSAIDENDAYSLARHLKPNEPLGMIKEVFY